MCTVENCVVAQCEMTATASTWSRKSPESADLVGDAADVGMILSYHGRLEDEHGKV